MNQNISTNSEEEISVKDIIGKIKRLILEIKSKLKLILLCGAIGSLLGVIFAHFQSPSYSSTVSFVVDEGKQGVSGASAMAAQFGLDIGGGSGSASVFSADNILLFLKSKNLCRQVLMTFYDADKKITLADKYALVYKMKKRWINDKQIGNINFSDYPKANFPRKVDSLMQVIVLNILKSNLDVAKPEKKASMIEVEVRMSDELLSKYFSDRLVDIAAENYVASKIKIKRANVMKLADKADSLNSILNKKTYNAGESLQALIDANPAISLGRVNSEISSRDKSMASMMYLDVVKNLEMARTLLLQETPVVQIIDKSTFPLSNKSLSSISIILISIILGILLATLYFTFKLLLNSIIR